MINHRKRGKWDSLSTDVDTVEAIVILFPSPMVKNVVWRLAQKLKNKEILTEKEYVVHLTKVQLVEFEGLEKDERLLIIDKPVKKFNS